MSNNIKSRKQFEREQYGYYGPIEMAAQETSKILQRGVTDFKFNSEEDLAEKISNRPNKDLRVLQEGKNPDLILKRLIKDIEDKCKSGMVTYARENKPDC